MNSPVSLCDAQAPGVEFRNPFYFLRHGETNHNRERVFQGQLDVELSELGREQAASAARILSDHPIARIVSSPLQRARITASKVAECTGVGIETDDDLMECHLGVHQGKPHAPWLADYWKGKFAPEGGEDFWQFRARVVPAMARLTAGEANVLIVAHGGLWYAARSLFRFAPDIKRMPNALPLRITPGRDGWTVERLGPDGGEPL